jgi:hypothetical protein
MFGHPLKVVGKTGISDSLWYDYIIASFHYIFLYSLNFAITFGFNIFISGLFQANNGVFPYILFLNMRCYEIKNGYETPSESDCESETTLSTSVHSDSEFDTDSEESSSCDEFIVSLLLAKFHLKQDF